MNTTHTTHTHTTKSISFNDIQFFDKVIQLRVAAQVCLAFVRVLFHSMRSISNSSDRIKTHFLFDFCSVHLSEHAVGSGKMVAGCIVRLLNAAVHRVHATKKQSFIDFSFNEYGQKFYSMHSILGTGDIGFFFEIDRKLIVRRPFDVARRFWALNLCLTCIFLEDLMMVNQGSEEPASGYSLQKSRHIFPVKGGAVEGGVVLIPPLLTSSPDRIIRVQRSGTLRRDYEASITTQY